MEHYKIAAISDILTRSDLGNTRADFADLVEQFEALKTARNNHAAQLELDLKKTRAEAFALLDSVPYLADWIAEKTGSAAVDLSEVITNYLNDDVDFNQIVSDRVDLDDLANDFASTAVDSYIENYVDFDELARDAINDISISIRID
tara:strand:+ start:807 stop:1247 length:441 start_codon:yes stop_codon:yes gene_type:complete